MSSPPSDLLSRFQRCRRYHAAKPWLKPFVNPRRFVRNQLAKRRIRSLPAGALGWCEAFHLPGFAMVVGESVSNEIASYGLFEEDLTESFLKLVKPGQAVVDVGMHVGYYTTLFALLVGPDGAVHAFEPTPSTREIARHNTDRFPQITVHPQAAWSSSGTLRFRDYGPQWMAFNSFTRAKLGHEPAVPREIEVPSITLDEFRQRLKHPVALVKIDAESAEREILKGARRLLAGDRPIVTVEVGDVGGEKEGRQLAEDLLAEGYQPWEYRHGRFYRHRVRETYGYDNLIWAVSTQDLSGL